MADYQWKGIIMKKKIIAVVSGLTLCFGMTGCTSSSGVQSGDDGNTTKIYNSDFYEFIDPETGVHYWVYSHGAGYTGMGGMTPRLNSDGTVMVTK